MISTECIHHWLPWGWVGERASKPIYGGLATMKRNWEIFEFLWWKRCGSLDL